MSAPYYLEDLATGMRFDCPTWPVTEADILRFAAEFDPQPFHLDHAAAASSVFRGLAASGWHTASMMMGMATRSDMHIANGHVGMNVEQLRFAKPVRPGDTLHMEIEILDARRSASRPDYGIVRVRWHARNQHGETVAEATPSMWVQARTAEPGQAP